VNLKIEVWNGYEIRFVLHNDEWVGLAKDIADALGYSDTNAMTKHMKTKYFIPVKLAGMNMKHTGLTEQGIYKAITRSQRPEAEDFEDWIFDTVKTLRKATGLEGFQIFSMLDIEHQKDAMKRLNEGLSTPVKMDYIKANTIANKAISIKYGHKKMVKKSDMTPEMLAERQPILDDTVELMATNEKFGLKLSVSEIVYGRLNTVVQAV